MLFCWNYNILYVHIYNLDLRFMASSVGSLRVPTVGFSAPFLDKPLTRNSHKTTKCVINLLKKNSSPYCVSHISLSEVQSLSPLIKNLVGGWPIHLKNMSSSDWIIIPTLGENKTCSKPPISDDIHGPYTHPQSLVHPTSVIHGHDRKSIPVLWWKMMFV